LLTAPSAIRAPPFDGRAAVAHCDLCLAEQLDHRGGIEPARSGRGKSAAQDGRIVSDRQTANTRRMPGRRTFHRYAVGQMPWMDSMTGLPGRRDRERQGFHARLRAFAWWRGTSAWDPSAARTLQFIPSAVHRISTDAAEEDDMTTSADSATAPYEKLAAAVRGDLIMPKDPGFDDAPPQAGQPETGRRRWALLAVVSAAQFLIILDLWVVNIALPVLQHDFAPATLSDVSWILDAYAIVLAALLLPAGRAADRIGRRKCFLAGLVVFGIASLGCAVAPDLPALIACRALQAAGAAVLLPASLGLALSVFPSHLRGTAVGAWAGVGAVAAGSGPVLGGLLVESSWRWIFLINVPVIVATLAAGVAILPRRSGGSERSGQRPGWRIDGVGTFLVLGAVGLVCTALAEAPGWPPARTWPVLAAGLVLAAAFVAHIRRHPDPLVAPRRRRRPLRLGRRRLAVRRDRRHHRRRLARPRPRHRTAGPTV
jgi:hypothetical protein